MLPDKTFLRTLIKICSQNAISYNFHEPHFDKKCTFVTIFDKKLKT